MCELSEQFVVQVIDIPAGMDDAVESNVALALVLLKRHTGLLLAVPMGFFSEESLAAGLTAEPDDQIGQSTTMTVPAGEKFDLSQTDQPQALDGAMVTLVVVDVANSMQQFLTPYGPDHDVDMMHAFDQNNPYLVPMTAELCRDVWAWVMDPGSGQRVAYYSADEGMEDHPSPTAVPLPTRPKASPSTKGGARPGAADGPRKPKPTVASLSLTMEKVAESIPRLADQLSALQIRQSQMEERLAGNIEGQSRPSALRQPLGSSITTGSLGHALTPAELVKQMPPPGRSTSLPMSSAARPRVSFAQKEEVQELLSEKQETSEDGDLAKAIYAQSQALTTLVQHLASSDPLPDLAASSSSSISSRGAQGRMKLQQELAMQRGSFFQSVLQAMARRMQPTRIAEQAPGELSARGITPTAYLERYGGYGKVKDIGCFQWQVGLIMEHLQHDSINAAKDAVALLAVCLEQTALDQGRTDVGLLLSLTEEPPAGVFTNRSLPGTFRGRPFAPLADQRWITTTLAYIKEMDLINSRRLDATTKPPDRENPGQDATKPNPKKAPRKQAKGNGKQKGQQAEEDA